MSFKKIVASFLIAFSTIMLVPKSEIYAQDKIAITDQDYNNGEVEMADKLRENGKIYVVVGSLTAVLIGVFVYLFSLEKKLGKVEKELAQK